MNGRHPPMEVRVWGELACFTRPENKVERVSYPVMTPSAARGVLEAIFWRPQFAWRIEGITVLRPIRYFSILRNEVNDRASVAAARRYLAEGGGYDAAGPDHRAQRHTLALRDVDYLISAQIEVKPGIEDDEAKYRDQFRRRVKNGRCFAMPYLGCREFTAYFSPTDGSETAIVRTEELGPMLLDIDYDPDADGRGTPRFFEARLDRGVLRIPSIVPEVV